MKVGLVGNYGHRNLGDEALLLGAIECARTFGGISADDIVVLSDRKADTDVRVQSIGCKVRQLRRPYEGKAVRLPLVIIDVYRALHGLDWLVFGGGGLLNDSNRTAVPMFVLIRFLAFLRGIRVAWWSIGIGPLSPGLRYRMACWLLSSSDFISVRDGASNRIASNMLGRDVIVAPDLAHALDVNLSSDEPKSAKIAVSLIPYKKKGMWFESNAHDYAEYVEKMVEVIRGLLSLGDNLSIRLIPVSLEQDGEAIQDIISAGEFATISRVVGCSPDSVQALLEEIGSAQLVVATRLHSVVLSILAQVPVVTIAYQPKVSSYTRELDQQYPCFSIEDFSSDEIIEAVAMMVHDAGSYKEVLMRGNKKRRVKLSESIALWRELL